MALLSLPTSTLAVPKVIEETAKISSPDPAYTSFPVTVAIDGDWLIATGRRDDFETGPMVLSAAWLYQRQSNGQWTLVRRLFEYAVVEDGDEPVLKVDMHGGVAAFIKEHVSWIFERTGSAWTSVPSPITTDGMDVEVDNGTIVVTDGLCSWMTNAYRKGTNGAWTLVRQTPPESIADCENEDDRGDADISGTAVIVATYAEGGAPHSARIFEGPFGTTPLMTRINESGFASQPVAIEAASALASRHPPEGILVHTRQADGVWSQTGALLRPDNLAIGRPTQVEVRGGLAIVGQYGDSTHGLNTGSVSVFERHADGTYSHVAKLVASDRGEDQGLGANIEISGRRVVASNWGTESVYVFELPLDFTEPAAMQDTFQDGSANDWTTLAGSAFVVATTSSSKVYRQSSIVGNAAALWNNTERDNQSIEADIRPIAYATSTGDKWFGLVTRYTDASNYYYVTLRNNNTVLLRRMVDGVFSTLASANLPITLNRTYRVRLEAIGTRMRVLVDNQIVAEASDDALEHGRAGVMMYKMRVDYDNIIVSSNSRTTLALYRFDGDMDSWENWESVGIWDRSTGTWFSQTDTTSGARAIAGIPTDDQILHVRARRTAAAGANNWFGLATRYRDAGNYYYLTLRNNNTISLRKLVNGSVVELDAAPFNVTSNTWYRLRFEAVGTHLRVYINGLLRLEASDASHPAGRYGPIMYRTAAQYDDVLAVQP
jgi:hypothetical protein